MRSRWRRGGRWRARNVRLCGCFLRGRSGRRLLFFRVVGHGVGGSAGPQTSCTAHQTQNVVSNTRPKPAQPIPASIGRTHSFRRRGCDCNFAVNFMGQVMFPLDLVRDAYQESNGEFGWTRAQIPLVVELLRRQGLGILGGELWWIRDGIPRWRGSIPQREGPPAVYCWVTDRLTGEPWPHFVERGAVDALAAVERWPAPDDLPADLSGRILYNLTWVSEDEFKQLRTKVP